MKKQESPGFSRGEQVNYHRCTTDQCDQWTDREHCDDCEDERQARREVPTLPRLSRGDRREADPMPELQQDL
ncbi:hypothetical protein [Nakamurella aerolata]|uniref:Uncharacterized protein n=1 Tax=Nakamurella aerolata TaxID=1656892 RepID=A0A849ACM3_9ACTN|nr:hypothetical protein [Nakamurella aerolata]NNG36931.1 hypothetical protein [Nakamurella aerolata]